MGKLSACLAIALAACGSSNSKPIDAPPIVVPDAAPDAKVFQDAPIDAPPVFDLSCIGNPAPTSGNPTVTVTGTVTEVGAGIPPATMMLSGAAVAGCTGDCSAPLASTTTDSNGAFSLGPITTNSMPLAAYLKVTNTGDRTVMEYPGEPLTMDLSGIPMFTFTPAALTTLAIAGCNQNDTANGMLGVVVTDCSLNPITDSSNVMLSIKQGGNPVTGTTVINIGQFASQFKGTYLICNVPANATTNVGATYKGMTFLAHDVAVIAGTTTATQVRPGY